MKCLTICNPYPHLILRHEHDPARKRVENRRFWQYAYRGPLLIHAGKSQDWLELDPTETFDARYNVPLAEMSFGAIVGVCHLSDVVRVRQYSQRDSFGIRRTRCEVPRDAIARWPWLSFHEHTEGPVCLVLTDAHKFAAPLPFRGQQGLFDVPTEVVRDQIQGLIDRGEINRELALRWLAGVNDDHA
jgi:hypothetical protein